MIKEDIDYKYLKNIFKLYKDNYKETKNNYVHNFIYEINNKIVAFVIYTVLYDNIEIIDVFVLNEYRKQGIATSLLNKIINDNTNKNITLEVNINNKQAIKLYEKLGFKKISVRKKYYDGVDGILMLKEVGS